MIGASVDGGAPVPRATLPARVAVGEMSMHRDRFDLGQRRGGTDGYIAVVYLSTGGTLVLEPDGPGEGGAWVPPTAELARHGSRWRPGGSSRGPTTRTSTRRCSRR